MAEDGPTFPFRALRELAGLSVSEVGRRMGMLRQHVTRMERTARPRLQASSLLEFMSALGGTVTLTVSRGRAWMTWTRRTTTPPPNAHPVQLTPREEDTDDAED